MVRAVTIYGADNGIDGIVLDVLLRKHEQIRKALGISVPVPDRSDDVVEAILEGLLLRDAQSEQLTLDFGLEHRDDLHKEWESAAEKEREFFTKYRQAGIHPEEVSRELDEMRASLGTASDVRGFTEEALRALRADVTLDAGRVHGRRPARCPTGCADALVPGHREPLPFHADLPVKPREAYLDRTDPNVAAIARYVLESALDSVSPADGRDRPARRCGVMRTAAVAKRTTLLLVRYRFHLELPGRDGPRQLVAEDAQVLAYRGPARIGRMARPPDEVAALLAAVPSGNIQPDQALDFTERAVAALDALLPHLDAVADDAGGQAPRRPHPRPRGRRRSGSAARSRSAPRNPPTSSASTCTCPAVRHERVRVAEDRRRPALLRPARTASSRVTPRCRAPRPESYGLEKGESVRRQASRSWPYLLETWQDEKKRDRFIRILLRELGFPQPDAGAHRVPRARLGRRPRPPDPEPRGPRPAVGHAGGS